MNRRSALRAILASCVAPAFVPVERLMRIKPIVVPTCYPAQEWVFRYDWIKGEILAAQLEYNLARSAAIQRLLTAEPPGSPGSAS